MSIIPSGGRSCGGQLCWACLRGPRGGDAIARNRFIIVWVWIGSRLELKFTWLFYLFFLSSSVAGIIEEYRTTQKAKKFVEFEFNKTSLIYSRLILVSFRSTWACIRSVHSAYIDVYCFRMVKNTKLFAIAVLLLYYRNLSMQPDTFDFEYHMTT